jgi:hypothetical protein
MPTARQSTTFALLQTVTTPTSPNTDVVTTATFDLNNTTHLSFQYQGRVPVWISQVSQSVQAVELGRNLRLGKVTWVKGLTVTYRSLDAKFYRVILDGKIEDDGTVYNHVGTTLGIFERPGSGTEVESAELDLSGLPEAIFQAPPAVDTLTSPNTHVVTAPAFRTDAIQLTCLYQDRIPQWTPVVSPASPMAVLGEDRSVGEVTWKKGLTITRSSLGGAHCVLTLDGRIHDGGASYRYAATVLGIFQHHGT